MCVGFVFKEHRVFVPSPTDVKFEILLELKSYNCFLCVIFTQVDRLGVKVYNVFLCNKCSVLCSHISNIEC